MAIKDQCFKCTYYGSDVCSLTLSTPDYNQRSCENYKTTSINLDKENHRTTTPSSERSVPPPPPLSERCNLEEFDSSISSSTTTEKQRMFSSPFSFEGRIRRTEYWISYLIYYAYAFALGIFSAIVNIDLEGFMLHIFLLPGYWFVIAQGVKRCHDRNNSGWYQLIPFYGLVMLFADGDEYENDYGPNPKGRNIYS